MFKAKALLDNGTTLLVMGITAGNVDRLKQGQPIAFNTADLHIAPGETVSHVTLFYAETEAELARVVRTLIGPETVVKDIQPPASGKH